MRPAMTAAETSAPAMGATTCAGAVAMCEPARATGTVPTEARTVIARTKTMRSAWTEAMRSTWTKAMGPASKAMIVVSAAVMSAIIAAAVITWIAVAVARVAIAIPRIAAIIAISVAWPGIASGEAKRGDSG